MRRGRNPYKKKQNKRQQKGKTHKHNNPLEIKSAFTDFLEQAQS
jgi:hypothetical protein